MIVTRENIKQVVDQLILEKHLACDTETYGLEYLDQLFSMIIASKDGAFYFNFKDYPEENVVGLDLGDSFIFQQIERLFLNPSILWFFHNAKFDMHKLAHRGWWVAGDVWCTKVHARILQNNLLSYTLEVLTRGQKYQKSTEADEYINKMKLKSKRHIAGKKKVITDHHYDQLPFWLITKYGLLDGLCTFELGCNQVITYQSRPELHRVRDNEIKLIKVIFKMERNGVLCDPEYILKAWKYEESLIREAEEQFRVLTGVPLKDTKKAQLVQILKDAGEIITLSDKNNPVLDSDALDKMTSPVAQIIQKVRYHEKRISSFYSTFMQYRDSHNIVHPNIDQAGTETGRFSMSTPNLQQLSKDEDVDEGEFSVRGCFIPKPGTIFVQWDWKQQEYKLMADYANERQLIDRINQGFDVHQATADLVGITRSQAKNVNFAILYGAGAAKLASMIHVTLGEAKKIIDKYYAALPMVENFIARVKGVGAQRGFIFNWLGRRCNIANREWAYILPNHLIQGSGADVMKCAIVEVDKFLVSINAVSEMKLTVHDSLIMQMVPEEFYLIPEITKILESAYKSKNGVTLTVDVEWSDKSLAKKDLVKGVPLAA